MIATAPAPTTTFLTALMGLLVGAGYTVTTGVETRYNRRVIRAEGVDGHVGVVLSIRVGATSGKVLSGTLVRQYSADDVYEGALATAADVAEMVGILAADSLPQHEEDQPAPVSGELVIYHGRLASERGVYRARGYSDRQGRPVLRHTWAASDSLGRDDIRISAGCRSITRLPRP